MLTSIHSFYQIPGICHEYEARQGFYGLRYGWLLYCLGFLFLHKHHHCCISLFCQLDIAIKSLCVFVAVSCDRIIHIGKFCENWNEFVHILLVIIKARLQGGADRASDIRLATLVSSICSEESDCSVAFWFVSIPCRPYCIKQISQSQSIKTLAYLFYTIRPAWDAYRNTKFN